MDSEDVAGDGVAPTVLCPQGHVNAWNYKFCSRCGSPIGVVEWPEHQPNVEVASRPKRRGVVAVLALAAAVLVSTVAVIGYFLTRTPSDDRAASTAPNGFGAGTASPANLAQPCGQGPVVEAESVDMAADGLTVSAAFLSRCPGGNTESGTEVRITVAAGDRDIAAGIFDFSTAALEMDPGVAVRRTLVFPRGTYWRTPDMFSGAPQLVFHRGGQSVSDPSAATSENLVAQSVALPEHGSVDGVAEAVLEELRDADYGYVSGSIENRWIAQISSKKPGITVEGKTLTSADVLSDHLDLRTKYDGTRLVWSGHWSTFNSPDWWVTVAGPPQLTATEANRWCDAEGFGMDDCFAKFVSSVFGTEGTTEYRK
ncbi:hypothetical protein [Mycobacterium sp. SMC-4]|uniref:hypothetical protein n=1 Tax=Mycobacterium sp. SMC-4 TaxID=2857059 RepID=UPI003D051C4E